MQYRQMVKPSSALCMVQINEYCAVCATNIDRQYLSVKYYDFLPDDAVPADGVDEKMKCVWFKWDRDGEAEHER